MRHLAILFYAWLLELWRKPIMLSDKTIRLLFIPGFNRLRTFNAKARAYAEFAKARKNVPAYRTFLKSNGFTKLSFTGMTPNINEIPITDKENYVNRFTVDERCVHGKVPEHGVIIDESSGSSGTATNWVRGQKERTRNAKMIRFSIRHLLGNDPLFIINAFALGPWATGINVTMSCVPFSKLKTLGPDKLKIENTLKHYGKGHKYLILGYPPFLKLLVDNSEIDWKEYNVSFIFGGESMTEGMRDYLTEKGIKKMYSSLGASDLELNLAGENEFTISLRKLLRSNPELRARILKHPGALPMLFQFNPSDFLFESTETGELIVTVCRPDYIAPKVRYNIHDRGHVLQMKELNTILKELNISDADLAKRSTDLPILLHYGRSDMTVSFFGANISPTDIQETLYNVPALAAIVNSFCLCTIEDKDGNKQLVISFELQKNKKAPTADLHLIQNHFFDQLTNTNQDFREARKMITSRDQTELRFYEFAEGPFKNNDIRIKAKYIS